MGYSATAAAASVNSMQPMQGLQPQVPAPMARGKGTCCCQQKQSIRSFLAFPGASNIVPEFVSFPNIDRYTASHRYNLLTQPHHLFLNR